MQGVSSWMLTSLWSTVALLCLSGGQPSSSEERRNYYDTLGVQRTATDRQVKKAFHKLAMTHHPDKNKSSEAEKIFREIVEAYEVLSNKEKRRQYDELGHKAFLSTEDDSSYPEGEDGTPFFHFSFDELFQDFNLDNDLFLEEPDAYWSFPPGVEDEDDPYEDDSIQMTDLFDLLDGSHYGDEEGQQFCWTTQRADGSTVEVCEGN